MVLNLKVLQVLPPMLVNSILSHIIQSHHDYFSMLNTSALHNPLSVPSAEPLFHRSMRYTADHGSDLAGSDDISMRTPNR